MKASLTRAKTASSARRAVARTAAGHSAGRPPGPGASKEVPGRRSGARGGGTRITSRRYPQAEVEGAGEEGEGAGEQRRRRARERAAAAWASWWEAAGRAEKERRAREMQPRVSAEAASADRAPR